MNSRSDVDLPKHIEFLCKAPASRRSGEHIGAGVVDPNVDALTCVVRRVGFGELTQGAPGLVHERFQVVAICKVVEVEDGKSPEGLKESGSLLGSSLILSAVNSDGCAGPSQFACDG